MSGIRVDFISNSIIVTQAFLDAAAVVGTEEYNELRDVRKENPNMKIVRRSVRVNKENHKSKGLTYAYMRNFIKVMDSDNRVTFEDTVDYFQDMYNGNSAKTYVAVRDWFLENYPRHAEMIVETAPKLPAA
ncbi:MAG: hypothetical protein HFG29_03960 [Eubacterium sp.]|nr:hypothetical protein [Eubacterium sp.]